MRHLSVLGLVALALGACAPTPPVSQPPAPVEAPAAAPEPASAPEPADALAAPPENWWLLDDALDGVRGISARRAYSELLQGREAKRSVVVAIIDSGVDVDHVDLDDNLWVNDGEIPANGRDDDNNGYVDDVHGWNFIGGPGGNVGVDTYEVTRLYAALRPRLAGANPDTLSTAVRAEYERFLEIQREFQKERAEATAELAQLRQFSQALEQIVAVLRGALGTDELTVEAVRALSSPRTEVMQARSAYLEITAAGITPEKLAKYREEVERRVEYGLNPEFDPRPLVGDRYDDPTEREYGNADVEGPFPEHGTLVAGIVGAERDNGIGVDGIAPNVRLMVLRTVPMGDERDKDVANAIRYAVDNGAHIINMSFGKGYSPNKEVVDAAVRYADARGVLLVHAAGNDAADLGVEPSFPYRTYQGGGVARHWIEVGASSWLALDRLAAPFSNFGDAEVDVFAPGVGILSTTPGNDYEASDGTSFAAPVVSGLAALLMSYYPELSAEQVRRIILDSAVRYPEQLVARPGAQDERIPFGRLSVTGGIVNAYAAVQMAEAIAGGR